MTQIPVFAPQSYWHLLAISSIPGKMTLTAAPHDSPLAHAGHHLTQVDGTALRAAGGHYSGLVVEGQLLFAHASGVPAALNIVEPAGK